MGRDVFKKLVLLASAPVALGGCMSIAAIEPVKSPPVNYQADVGVQVEFLHPSKVGPRCAQRGVSVLGMPMPSAMACANPSLMTLPNPCDTVTGGWYAAALCAEIAHTRGWSPDTAGSGEATLRNASWTPGETFGLRAEPPGTYRDATAIRVEFVASQDIGLRCAARGALAYGKPTLNALSCSNAAMMTLPNPCSVIDGGWYADLLCHEMGHVNGWPANHAGGSFLKDGRVPVSHTVPDDDGFVMDFILAVQKAQANARRGDPVRATVLAGLADNQAEAQQIALKAGIRQLPDIAVPRLEQIPELLTASLVLPTQPATLRAGPDFSRPMGPFARRKEGLRLTRRNLEAMFAGTPAASEPAPAVLRETVDPAGLSNAQLHTVAHAPGLSAGLPGQRTSLRGRGDAQFLLSQAVHVNVSPPEGAGEAGEPVPPAFPGPTPPAVYAAVVYEEWRSPVARKPWLADRILPFLPENY